MAWLRFTDDWNRKPEIRALDDATYRALQCLIEAAEHFDRCGMVTDDYAMGTYPNVRRKLRGRVRDLDDRGLVHLLGSTDDYHPNCPSCLVRRTEAMTEGGTEAVQKQRLSASTSARSGRTKALLICIPSFYEVALTPEAKREKRQKDAARQQRKRDRDKGDPSRRDAEPPSRPPVPVPKLRINDLVMASEEPEPALTADPSIASNGAAELNAGSWLRREWDRRQKQRSKPAKWKADYQPHLDSIVQKATEAEGNTIAILTAALNAFFADSEQQGFRCIPKGLDWKWDQFAGPYLEQTEAEAKERKIAEREAEYQRKRQEYDARAEAERQQKRESNGKAVPGNNLGMDPASLADLLAPIGGSR